MTRTIRSISGAIDYELIQTQRHSMEIRVLSGGDIRLFTPKRVPLKACDAFVLERAAWIVDRKHVLNEYLNRRSLDHPVANGATVMFEGEPVELRIRPANKNMVRFEGDYIMIMATDCSEHALREQLKRFLTERARERIQQRLHKFAPAVGWMPERVAIRDQRTRWGSFSNKQNLNFNWKLIMAPPEALDYVVIHELCHYHEFNHSPKFWARVEAQMPDYALWKTWLSQNGSKLTV